MLVGELSSQDRLWICCDPDQDKAVTEEEMVKEIYSQLCCSVALRSNSGIGLVWLRMTRIGNVYMCIKFRCVKHLNSPMDNSGKMP